ncbi:MAG: hypothetical protein LH616_07255 [Ilumatobacteraceae bacterium]|nr:hypothetical protein [Ilumatobacteraceae bacterium]
MRRALWVCLGLLAVMSWGGRASAAPPTEPVDPTAPVDTVAPSTTLAPGELPPTLGSLIVVPTGCAVPAPATAVFVAQLAYTDVPPTTARFRVERVLAGSLDGFVSGRLVDVRYGDETRFLTIGSHYVIGVAVSASTGVLVSTVREAAPLFGGDAVIGANDSDVDCPRVEDPVRTLTADGGSVDTGVLTPLKGQGGSLLSAVLRPFAVAFAVLLLLVLVKQAVFAVGRSLRDVSLAEPAPRKMRQRQHQPGSPAVEQPGP